MLFDAKREVRSLSHVPLTTIQARSRGYWSHRVQGYLLHFSHPSPARAPYWGNKDSLPDYMPTSVLIQSHTNHNLSLEVNTCSSWEIRVTLRNAPEGRKNSEHRFGNIWAPSSLKAAREMLQVGSASPSQSWSSVPSAASSRLRITPAMEKEKREDHWRGREATGRKAEKKESGRAPSYVQSGHVQFLQLIFVSLLTQQLKKDLSLIPPQPWELHYHNVMSVETSAPKTLGRISQSHIAGKWQTGHRTLAFWR